MSIAYLDFNMVRRLQFTSVQIGRAEEKIIHKDVNQLLPLLYIASALAKHARP